MNRHFNSLLDRMRATHDKKSADYASDSDPFSNFRYAAQVAESFTGVNQVFATLIAVKLARLAQLHGGKVPNNESIEDSHLDLATYCAIWSSYQLSEAEKNKGLPCAHENLNNNRCVKCGLHENNML